MAEPIEMPVWVGLERTQGRMCYLGMHITATWRIRLNRLSAEAMQSSVKLL